MVELEYICFSSCIHHLVYCLKDSFSYSRTSFAATIFAYGQTSSGKTFTMRGITESAVNDIYEHIKFVNHTFSRIFCCSMIEKLRC